MWTTVSPVPGGDRPPPNLFSRHFSRETQSNASMISPTGLLPGVTKSASRKRTLFCLGALTMLAALAAGCATGPKYEYTQHEDSASVEGPGGQNRLLGNNGSCSITITKVDGFNSDFIASCPGVGWPFFTGKERLYLTPDQHTLKLNITETESQYGDTGHGATGLTGTVASGSTPTITVELKANHIYRFAAFLAGSTIDLALWDETSGPAARSRVANWTFDSNSNYSGSSSPSGNHR